MYGDKQPDFGRLCKGGSGHFGFDSTGKFPVYLMGIGIDRYCADAETCVGLRLRKSC